MIETPVAPSLSGVMPSQIRELADVAFGMEGVLKLHFGESNMPTPDYIKQAASQALNVGIRCAIDPGAEAIVLTPNWPNGAEIVRMFGATPVEVPFAYDGERFSVDMEAVAAALTGKTRLLLYTSPSNPLGWVATQAEQQALLDFCRRHGLWLLADEVYERLYYQGDAAPSILRLCTRDDAVIVVQSFSKTYCMTGWRLGWLVSRRDLVRKATQLNEFIVSHAPTMIQRAGIVALERGDDDVSAMVEMLAERMSFCYDALTSSKRVSLPKPAGAFYLFPRIEGVSRSFDFAVQLLKETKVSVAPGAAFGDAGEGALRVCFASDMSILEPAMERMVRFIERY
jgi:aspartate/methionine/tyrosine aminotransferase